MKTLQIAIAALVLTATSLMASDFKINTFKGDVQVKKESDWVTISKNIALEKGDQIKLGKKSYLSLVHTNGNPVELKRSGNYTVAKLIAKANRKKSDVTKKFTKYILDELGGSDDLLASGDVNENMATLGAVERAMGDKFNKNGVEVKFPRSSYTTTENVDFSWYGKEEVSSYKFFIKNPDDEVIFEKQVSGLEIAVNLNEVKVGNGECYYWGVEASGKASEEFCIYRLDQTEVDSFNEELSMIRDEVEEGSSISHLVLASFYAENKMVNAARDEYLKAIEISPDVDNFKALYAKYLVSIGMSHEAENIVKEIKS